MTLLHAFILGVVQGITEFLTVSSSGHLVLLQEIFGINEPALLFDTVVHVGTLIAVCAVLWQDIWSILRKIIQPLTLFIIIGTIPAVAAALLFRGSIEAAFSSTTFLGFAFLITSVLLVVSEKIYSKIPSHKGTSDRRSVDLRSAAQSFTKEEKIQMTWLDALVIGIFQAVAIIPGISRSGSTLAGAFFRGLSRDLAVRFSFLLSIPAILGALVLQLKDLYGLKDFSGSRGSEGLGIGATPLLVGAVSAAIVGFFSIKLMLKIVREKSLLGFALYTGVLGLLVIVDRFAIHFFL